MNSLDVLHPDHLHDRARKGELAPREWQALGAHLASCHACAWEQALTHDFAREARDAEDEAGDAELDALIDDVLDRSGFAEPREPSDADGRARRDRPARLSRWSAVLLFASAAAAVFVPVAQAAVDARHDLDAGQGSDASLDAGALGLPSGGSS